jgi:crotonobetainyl-CoA:carnitine CoA-transferase CaiB-like acyl-CoA transferase
MDANREGLLGGMRVVSFCHYLQGPAATQYLADMGAEVIKIEPPKGAFERHWAGANGFVGDISVFYLCANRNKRSLAIDLKRPEAREVVYRLIDRADAVVENFRPGVLDRLGFGYEEVAKRKPDIIYASATGFGSGGPAAKRPGQDLLIQARSGLAGASGEPGVRPTPVGCAAADQHGGALLALGILGAYANRLTTGKGTRVEASLFNAGIDLQTEPLTLYMTLGKTREAMRHGPNNATWFHGAPYGVYRVADAFVALSLNDLGTLARALDSERLAALSGLDPYEGRERYTPVLAEELAGRAYAELAEAFDAAGVWYARVQDYDDLKADPQAIHNEVFREVPLGNGTATLVNHPLRYDGEVPPLRRLSLEVGEDGREILAELGYSPEETEALIAGNVIVAPDMAERASA